MSDAIIDPVAKPDAYIEKMKEDWEMIDALYGGTQTMRDAGEKYLPKRPLEEKEDYAERVKLATLFPAFSETVMTLVGRAFSESIVYDEKLDKFVREELVKDIDLQGRNLEVYSQDWFNEAMRYGLSHTLIEAPKSNARTREEEQKEKARPYLIQICPKRILGHKAVGGKLTQVRIKFYDEEEDPQNEFAMICVERIRVYDEKVVRVYRFNTKDKKWQKEGEDIPHGFGFVPLVTLYTNRTGFMKASPPLRELAHLNIKHWVQQSGVDSLIDVACVPILAVTGVDTGAELVIGARHAVKLPVGAEMKYVEHTGAAIETAAKALDALKDEMRQAGAKLLQKQETAKTATESREDSARENSQLGRMVKSLEDTLDLTLDMMMKTRGKDSSGGNVTLNPNLNPDMTPNETMKTLEGLRNSNIISDETLFNEAKKRGIISDDVEWEDEQAKILEQMRNLGIVPGSTPPVPEEEELDAEGKPIKKNPSDPNPAPPVDPKAKPVPAEA